jgi:hypothetical protein
VKLFFRKPLALQLIQSEIKTVELHQLGVISGFDDPSPVEHQNGVGIPGRRQPMGDDNGCSMGHQVVQSLLDFVFGL